MGTFDVPDIEYTRYSSRQLLAVPLAVLAVALLVLGGTFVMTGAPVPLGMDFAGGAQLTVQTTSADAEIQDAFTVEPDSIQAVQAPDVDNQYTIQFAGVEDDDVISDLATQAEANLAQDGDASIVQSESTASASFAEQAQQTALLGIAAAFVGMSVIAFLLFRTFVPSIAIVASAFSDMVIPLAFMSVADIPLSLGTVAALLMLIGYSVDSDILLNNHVLRRQGDFYESTHRAMRTGITMTVTSMMAMLVMGITASLFGVELLASVGIILFVGLAADLMNTYLMNVTLLRWYKFHGVRS
ncbi:protein translocase subunit SecF [Natronobacterium gregoryi]|uniref:Protein-export membrane protein SecF n=2 Tax=Natronobacterium gregoryi TaxID=44930 RepID=L0AFP4_NATGS|nr:protein translocase subunit SecF [Natronobacterium gregoryi]AFZ72249.1 preprotein translocase subunit SecF [Natronobacterium gregoryi SP2]ELY62351.1 preprotein translocase subunit SecF [Natronobacterium gregoryi SP2]PLK20196.1 protein translocase subunit SecF [Natronobacterium gregoryi SP2]SFJ28911.1 protein translocase subunit secF [Natronobacterium gregoryi]